MSFLRRASGAGHRDGLGPGADSADVDLAQPSWAPSRAGTFTLYDIDFAKRTVREELGKMGIDIRDPEQPVTLSGGERQSLAISRDCWRQVLIWTGDHRVGRQAG